MDSVGNERGVTTQVTEVGRVCNSTTNVGVVQTSYTRNQTVVGDSMGLKWNLVETE